MLPKTLKTHRQIILSLFFIATLTIIIWYKLLFQAPLGEGYYYFDHGQDFITAGGQLSSLNEVDNLARFLFDVLPPFFGDNLSLYMAFQLFNMVLLNWTCFYFVRYFTKNIWISLTAVTLFTSSYVAQFEMLGTGNYQRFVQRIPCLIPLLFSFIQLDKYLHTAKVRHFLIAQVLFIIAVLTGHFSTFLTPLFGFYPLLYSVIKRQKPSQFFHSFLIGTSFFLINYVLIQNDHLKPGNNIWQFIQQHGIGHLTQLIIFQFGNMLIPPFLLDRIAAISNPFDMTVIIVTIPFLIMFLIGLLLIIKRKSQYLLIYSASLIITPILLFLDLFLGKVSPAYNIRGYNYYFLSTYYLNSVDFITVKGDRYYLVPYLFIAIMIALLIYVLFSNLKFRSVRLYPVVTIIFLSVFVWYNTTIIWRSLDLLQPMSDVTKQYINYTKQLSPQFTDQSMILAPRTLIWPSSMIRVFYAKNGTQFRLFRPGWESEIVGLNPQNIFIFDYDYKQKKVIDLTAEFRRGEKIKLPIYQ